MKRKSMSISVRGANSKGLEESRLVAFEAAERRLIALIDAFRYIDDFVPILESKDFRVPYVSGAAAYGEYWWQIRTGRAPVGAVDPAAHCPYALGSSAHAAWCLGWAHEQCARILGEIYVSNKSAQATQAAAPSTVMPD